MCICVDCQWVDRCKAYHRVETQHGEPHLNGEPDFEPEQPRIHVSLRPIGNSWGIEWDVRSCSSFALDRGHWQRLRPGAPVPT